ncbi:MAG TPA: hypothetical protein VMU03_03800 [Gammaproteobacteria bacterium]|jgi:hypothetical protein|nr:hypothetical protein [Gammaproteobacteria bacterium]
MREMLNTTARALGALCGAVLAVVWAVTLWVPAAGLNLSGISVVVALLLTVLAVFAAIASVHGHATVVVLLFLASFFPIGSWFFTRTERWLLGVAWLDVGLLVAAALMWLTRAAAPPAPEPVD